jgi:cellulose biosynthesis protein BcsQ
MGNVITFYSYKGGVGRSMALANIGVLLARWNKKVLLIDWDLEAPGLENYFKPLISDFSRVIEKDGLIDLLHKKTEDHLLSAKSINWKDYFIEIPIDDRNKTVYLLTSGKKDEHYVSKIRQFDFQSFYNDHDGGDFLEDIRTAWKNDSVLFKCRIHWYFFLRQLNKAFSEPSMWQRNRWKNTRSSYMTG